jgi:capping protein beta
VIACALASDLAPVPPVSSRVSQIEDNLYDLLDVAPDLTEDLLGSVDQPLKTCLDPVAGREFLLCDYNRDADFYRSPYTNKYYDPEDPTAAVDGEEEYDRPSDELRKYEEAANEVFDMYRERYYSGPPAPKVSLSSAYFWDPVGSDATMAGCILFHNVAETPVRVQVSQLLRAPRLTLRTVAARESQARGTRSTSRR